MLYRSRSSLALSNYFVSEYIPATSYFRSNKHHISSMSESVELKQKASQMELLWWILSILAAVGVVLPIWFAVGTYKFMPQNIIFVIAFITFSRYIFLLRFTFLAERQRLKQVVIFLCIPAIFFLVQEINAFQTFIDENGVNAILGSSLPTSESIAIGRYLRAEMLLFAVGSVIASVVLPFRLGLSIWRTRNRGTV